MQKTFVFVTLVLVMVLLAAYPTHAKRGSLIAVPLNTLTAQSLFWPFTSSKKPSSSSTTRQGKRHAEDMARMKGGATYVLTAQPQFWPFTSSKKSSSKSTTRQGKRHAEEVVRNNGYSSYVLALPQPTFWPVKHRVRKQLKVATEKGSPDPAVPALTTNPIPQAVSVPATQQ